ncbi:hypothetical protein GCM10010357_32320 [Streptomyces luteireticuli]|uniref:Uncharacterized protein n=1 Tax=Streptomyces luteireticuli TaxID=173858 RepID=A0ABP3IKS8_9ACTN
MTARSIPAPPPDKRKARFPKGKRAFAVSGQPRWSEPQLWPPASFSRRAASASSDARAPEVSADSEEYEPPAGAA